MSCRLRLLRSSFKYVPVLVLSGSLVTCGLNATPTVSRNESSKARDIQWPETRPIVARSRKGISKKIAKDESEDEDVHLFEDDDTAAWTAASSQIAVARDSLAAIQWSALGDNIAHRIVPAWAQVLPGYFAKLQQELDTASGSLSDEIWQEAQDPYHHPEIAMNANVRVGGGLCADELAFIRRRKAYMRQKLATYLDIPIDDVDPRDVPTIAICGSGGGLRALVAGASSCLSAQEAGLFDCVTYTAGVSGSCWLQALYNSELGGRRHDKVIEQLKRRIGIHIAYPPSFLELLTHSPTNKFLLSGSVEKIKGDPSATFGLVDAYGILLAGRLLIPRDELSIDDGDLKLSNQRKYLTVGANPLPIYAAVRHEIPEKEHIDTNEKAQAISSDVVKVKAQHEGWFQWFEFTPYELWCEEIDAGIPSWSIGRHFSKGRSVLSGNGHALPELRIPFLMGIWGSAFCATLSHYYKEIRPILKGLTGFGGIDDLIEGKNGELIKVHPIEPGHIPNFALGLQDHLPSTTPTSMFREEHLELMDVGMSNNLPIYPLLRKGREIDIIVCFDASANIRQENWLSVVDGYAKQRGVRSWPVGAGWPKTEDDARNDLDATPDAATAQQAAGEIADAREKQRRGSVSGKVFPGNQNETDLGFCNVWVGTTIERKSEDELSQKNRVHADNDRQLLAPDAGITVVYFPFLPNPSIDVVDPNTSSFMNTWNFVYTPGEIEKVVSLARANFRAGQDQTKRTVRAVYERKKAKRLELEGKVRVRWWRNQWRERGDHFQ